MGNAQLMASALVSSMRGSSLLRTRGATLLPAATRMTVRPSSSNAVTPLKSDDHSYDYAIQPIGDPSKRAFTYAALGGARFIYASATRLIAMKFIASMAASEEEIEKAEKVPMSALKDQE